MEEIIVYIILASISFTVFLFLIAFGLIRKRRLFYKLSIPLLLISLGFGAVATYQFVTKSYEKVSEKLKPRSGMEVYTALFGKPVNDCVNVQQFQDQVILKIDPHILLHCNTCPLECSRILSEYEYEKEVLYSYDPLSEIFKSSDTTWWHPEQRTDSLYKYSYEITEGRNWRILWMNADSSELYCRDILD